ncbi:unnamed protein product [Calypogeia fissa]
MDLKQFQGKLGIPENGGKVLRKSQELQRLSKVHFNASEFGVGEICKAVLCVELACQSLQVLFDRQRAIRCSGLSEKAYMRSSHALQNALGLRKKVDVRELAVQFGCVRLIATVHKTIALYQQRFVAALPESRRSSADFNRPVFTSVAFYLCAKKHKLKVDKPKLMEVCGSSDSEFSHVTASMMDLCFDVLGTTKEKKDPKSVKTNRDLLDALPGKRKSSDDDSDSDDEPLDDEDQVEVPGLKRSKKAPEKESYKEWRDSVIAAREVVRRVVSETGVGSKKPAAKQKQMQLNFQPVIPSPAT